VTFSLEQEIHHAGRQNVRNNQPDLQTRWFISNYLVAAVDESERADQVMEALRYAGFYVNDMQHLPADEAARQIDTSGEHSGKLKQVSRVLWSYISIQGNILMELAKAAWSGSRILAIQVRGKEEADLAIEILQADHPHPIQHFGLYGEVIQGVESLSNLHQSSINS
jgi:hypothetical protein